MMDPWWDPQTAGIVGAVLGGVLGGIGGGVGGALAGIFAPRGRHKGLVLGWCGAVLAIGVLLLSLGCAALFIGQPRHVWYPLLLAGGILSVVLGCNLPIIVQRYRQAERRRLDAADLRGA